MTEDNTVDFSKLEVGPAYSPFHPDLDEKFPIEKMLSKENADLVTWGKITSMGWVSFFRNSPMQNAEAEMLMGQFVVAAARAGQWLDIPKKGDEPVGDEIEVSPEITVDVSNLNLEFTRAAGLLKKNGFAEIVEDDDGREWISPKEKMLEFISERLKPYRPKEEKESEQKA